MNSVWNLLYPSKIDSEMALRIAKQVSEARSLPWLEPVHVRRTLRSFVVWTHTGHKGGNVEFHINARSGRVVRVWGPLSR